MAWVDQSTTADYTVC